MWGQMAPLHWPWVTLKGQNQGHPDVEALTFEALTFDLEWRSKVKVKVKSYLEDLGAYLSVINVFAIMVVRDINLNTT